MIAFKITGFKEYGSDLFVPVNDDIKSLEKEGIMELDISFMFKKLYVAQTYEIAVEYNDILENLYTQTISINAMRKNDIVKFRMDKISKQELISSL